VIDEDTPEFVKEAWADDSLNGLSQRYLVLSQMISGAVNGEESHTPDQQQRLRKQIAILWVRTKDYPKLRFKSRALMEKFDDVYRDADGDAEASDERE